jgi:cytochrome P450
LAPNQNHQLQAQAAGAGDQPDALHDATLNLSRFGSYLERQRFWRDPVGYVTEVHRAHGRLHAFGRGRPEYLFAFAPEHNKQMNENTDRYYWAASKKWTGGAGSLSILRASISNMDGQEYWTRKELMLPAFHRDVTERAMGVMLARTTSMLDGWRAGDVRDVHRDIRLLVHAVSMGAVLGLHEAATVDRLYELIESIYTGSGSWAMLIPLDAPGTPRRAVRRAADDIVALLRGIIQDKRSRGEPGGDMLATMMQSRTEDGQTLSETELVSEVYNVMGHDTTVCALMWTLILVALHPRVSGRLQEELDSALRGAAPTPADLPRLTYLDAVLKEAMRLCPPQSVSRRFNHAACRLGPYDLQQPTIIFMSSYVTHRLPDIYTDAQRFDPDRWQTFKPGPFEYFPFGAGVHSCVGRGFATLEMKLVLALLFQRFQLALAPGARIDRLRRARLLLGPRGAVPFTVVPRGTPPRVPAVSGDIREMVDLDRA